MTSRSAATGGVHSRPCLASVASQPARGVTQVEWYVCLIHVQEHRRFPSRFTRFSKLLRPPPGSMCRPPYYPGRPGALRPHPFRSQKPTRKAALTLPPARVIFAAGPGQKQRRESVAIFGPVFGAGGPHDYECLVGPADDGNWSQNCDRFSSLFLVPPSGPMAPEWGRHVVPLRLTTLRPVNKRPQADDAGCRPHPGQHRRGHG